MRIAFHILLYFGDIERVRQMQCLRIYLRAADDKYFLISAQAAIAASSECAMTQPSICKSRLRVTTTVVRPGNGLPMESNVLRPMIM